MIEYKRGDILKEDVEALVNTVNCVGVMGRGIALQFKKAFPDNFKAYVEACKKRKLCPGRVFVFQTGRQCNPYCRELTSGSTNRREPQGRKPWFIAGRNRP